ncbi:sensor histidine kinase [Paenibacillus odorifer]|jgi:two-component system sensor histidine kinase YesM|uniref:cache domain-containing sensor histidine kinase n=1 Tax=Paenibacillus TaxID=44249 RepID=UPI00096DFD46|nr:MULTISPECIES: sensor histidine kinase [Paenibacillus]MDH6426898.1 two-component system sensor histidine kinase YesM [Paenibacillus sp. PastH-4]MDH6442926.1 two-component system sensor histidine kinase YesM [Paenibacillus sp. PastF-4]MDH6526366.1 two-component system sensor histidine kinase YesM [Paenibacillus sp. PastH-3]OMC74944.1 sensor histidine kinase [Paenibacillus odorifer]OMD66992.1 sensor histidine kinase [Paenibacillus odorifer]
MKLRRKILFAIILLVFIPVILMGIVTYVNFSNAMEKKSSNFYWISLLETDRKLKFALSEITSITNSKITQPVVQQSLKQKNFVITYDRKQELSSYLIDHPMITSFSFYSKDRLIYQYNASMSFEDLKRQSWFDAMEGAEGRPVWSGPGENGSEISGNPVLVQARVIKDSYSLEDIGYLVVNVKPDLLDQIFWEAATLKKGDILLVNKLGNIVFNKSGEHIGQRTEFPFLQNDYAKEHDYYIDNYQGEKSLITFLPSHNAAWYLVAITPMNLISSESVSIRNIAIILSTVSLLSAILFDRYFVRRLVHSINSAVNGMKRVKQGIFTPITTPYRADDESDLLIDGFNRMSTQINELLVQVETEQGRKKEAEMQALMAQINPHFIYNSLESINSMAVLQGNKDISKMVISLGKLLRISISQNQELIPLHMEFEHVRHYLDIQKFRFEDKFSYIIDLSDGLRTFMTQKLIVQPIVENALYHAIEQMEDPGVIEITAYEMGMDMIIIVKDNGPGFDLAKMMSLWDNEGSAQKKYSDSGVGLKNVHERLNIRFGSPYGILVCSSPGFGSTIRIRIPKILP